MSEMEVPSNAPEHCPGTQSDDAGKASACAGCPNQNICASGETKGPDPGIAEVRDRLSTVKYKILVLSGKGGVGKSTLTSLLARALAAQDIEKNVGILDIDICGPSQPRVMGCLNETVHNSGSGWSPVYVDENLSVMSLGFFIDPDDAVIWRGPKKNGMIKKFLSMTDWGAALEYLLLDTPPGTSDEHLSTHNYLKEANLTGAVVITTPQEIALLDVRKEIDFCRKVGIPILGVIENMSIFVCPKCKYQSEIFPARTGGATQMCKDLDLIMLGSLPLDPRLARACDEGKNFIAEMPDTPAVKALNDIVQNLVKSVEGSANQP